MQFSFLLSGIESNFKIKVYAIIPTIQQTNKLASKYNMYSSKKSLLKDYWNRQMKRKVYMKYTTTPSEIQ